MVIIFGTYLLGKKARVADFAHCAACNRPFREMSSFSAWEVFHLCFIPLIPMGRYRFVSHCPGCEQCYKIPHAKVPAAIDEQRQNALAAIDGSAEDVLQCIAGLAHLGDFDGVEEVLGELARRRPELQSLARGRYLQLRKDLVAAEEAYRQACADDPSSPAAAFWLGRLLLAMGRDAEALGLLQQAQQMDPDYEYIGLLDDFAHFRRAEKNWEAVALLLGEIFRRDPDALQDKAFAKFYNQTCKKTGQATSNPYAQA